LFFIFALMLSHLGGNSQTKISFEVSMDRPETQTFDVTMRFQSAQPIIKLQLPAWSPGYYQKMNYAANVSGLTATLNGKALAIADTATNTWIFKPAGKGLMTVKYRVKASRSFVASSFLNDTHGYIVPTSMFLYIDGFLNQQVILKIRPGKWKEVVTGLDPYLKQSFTFIAPDYDVLYDSPLLTGKLDSLEYFRVRNVPHYFKGFDMGTFDKSALRNDLIKIVTAASDIIDDIPYRHYTFIGIGPGQGGIEHLNSTTISFKMNGEQSKEGRLRNLHFIAHEYFHHYNVKRIRPFELGPFDYQEGSRTNLLWVSEGLSVYYEYLVVKRAGLSDESDLLNALRGNIIAFESKTGKQYQSLSQASYETWSDGPFGRTGDSVIRTISYYDKGPVVGMLLDFAIRNATSNAKSLDDVMRHLYNYYYKKLGRGFTDAEFQQTAETIAGIPLTEVFEYVYTTRELDYKKYLGYAGLEMNTTGSARFTISRMKDPTPLQTEILKSWLN
jgi:predicted metalloprotease with PDZ domain